MAERKRPMRKIVGIHPPGIYTNGWTYSLSCGHLVSAKREELHGTGSQTTTSRERVRCEACEPTAKP